MSSNTYVCEFCKKEYTSFSSLKYHQKNTKFCIELQTQLSILKCEYCDKTFSTHKYLKQHSQHCKIYKVYLENNNLKEKVNDLNFKLEQKDKEFKVKLDQKEKEFKLKLNYQEKETDVKLKAKDDIIKYNNDIISKLQKEIDEYKKLATRPTNIYNTNNTNNNTNNYQIQYNQLVDSIEPLNSENICKRIDSIQIDELTNPGINDFENRISNRLSRVFKDFTFCTDKARKTVVIKSDNGEIQKVLMNEFIETGLTLGIQNIISIIEQIEIFNDGRMSDFDRDLYIAYDESLQQIKDYFIKKEKEKTKVSVNHGDYPLPSLVKNTLTNCTYLSKI
jgi:hypothetical protein